jgi:hypothetical protein
LYRNVPQKIFSIHTEKNIAGKMSFYKNNGNIEIKIENGEIENVVRNPFLNNTSIPVC